MQRLAADVDCAVGTAYTYFPSKSALVAELQRDAIEVLTASYLRFRAALDGTTGADPLTHLVGFSRFWVSTSETYPDEARLLLAMRSFIRRVLRTELSQPPAAG